MKALAGPETGTSEPHRLLTTKGAPSWREPAM